MSRFPARALMATGIGHPLLGLLLFREPLAAIGGVGAFVMPVSGFWILIAIALLVFRAARGVPAVGGSAPAAPHLCA